jgi:hypothetical protein
MVQIPAKIIFTFFIATAEENYRKFKPLAFMYCDKAYRAWAFQRDFNVV